MATITEMLNKPYLGEVTEGKHICVIKAFTPKIEAEDASKHYVELVIELDGTREFKKNLFNNDLTFFLSHTRRQLGRQTEDINPREYVNELINDGIALDIYFSYPEVDTLKGKQRVQNIHWLPPLSTTSDETEVVDDTIA